MKKILAGPLALSLLASALLAGCASTPRVERNLERIGFSDPDAPSASVDGNDMFRRIGAEPTNARLHFDNGRFLLERGRRGDLEVARVAFANATLLAADWWQPQVGLAATEYRLGHHDAALVAFSEAIALRGQCDELCYGLAFIAYRAGYFGLAATAHAAARASGAAGEGAAATADAFLSMALSATAEGHDAAMLARRIHGDAVVAGVGDGNVSIDAYVIRQSRDASSSAGINLLNALELQFGGTLFAADYSKANDDPTSKTTSRSLEVSIPTVSYALNMASTSRSAFSIEASPSVVAIAGKTSRFFEGSNVMIVPRGDETEPLERDIGIDLKVTPNEIGDGYIDLTATLELSNLSGTTIAGEGATIVQTDKTQAEATARIPFGRAIAFGSVAAMTTREGEAEVPGIRRVPGVSRLFGSEQASATRSDVLVLMTARRGIASATAPRIDAGEMSQRLFGRAPATVAQVSRLPSQAPRIDFMDWLQG
ncbi:MAG: type II and III secretion system protein [Pseudomonadota bacterium]|nr:type II and III secretion system protein [Pseudomonadota bacterium]